MISPRTTSRKPSPSKVKFMSKLIQRVCLSGLSHCEYALVAKSLVPGETLLLARDPDNKFDHYAIKVLFPLPDGAPAQVGWIPKGQNEMLSRILDSGVEVTCNVISHETNRPLTERLYVASYLTVSSEAQDD